MTQTLHEMVSEAARVHVDKPAAVFHNGDSASARISYREMSALADELQARLRISLGQSVQVLGLYCHTDILLPVWILSVLQLPAAYVPLDPVSTPQLTLRIMGKCKLRFCLIQSSLLHKFKSAFSSSLSLDVCENWATYNLVLVKIQNLMDSSQASNRAQIVDDQILMKEKKSIAAVPISDHQGEQLAYVLHTSGTTGFPKIVKVPHKCIVPNIIHLRLLFQMTSEDVVFLASPLTFDPSAVEMFLALTSGACLLMVPSAIKRMPGRLASVLFKQNSTTVLQATPTLVRRFGLHVLQKEVLCVNSSLRVLALGGEACPSLALLRSWRQDGNKTKLYNLYGTTEVSCWACCYGLPLSLLPPDDLSDTTVPLGEPLMDTAVEVRDERGCLVTKGEGQVFIGGQKRVCLLDDEMTTAKGTMRATGDWVMVRDSQLYYLGRKDRIVKRHGQRIHLDALQQAAESLPHVGACVVGLHEGSRLVAFVVPTTYKQTIFSSKSRDQQEQPGSSSTGVPTNVHKEVFDSSFSSRSLEKEILQGLSQLFPSHSIPDAVFLVPALPLTNHGKVAMKKLMRMYERQREVSGNHTAWADTETVRERLQTLWKDCLGLTDDEVVTEDAHFMLSGGDSLQALRLFDYITVTMGTAMPGLLEVLLDGSFSDVVKHITMTQHSLTQISAKRPHENTISVVPSKRNQTDGNSRESSEKVMAPVVSSVRGTVGFVVVRRAGQVQQWNYSQNKEQSFLTDSKETNDKNRKVGSKADINKYISPEEKEGSHTNQRCVKMAQSDTLTTAQLLNLQILWSSDTGRCVDASPVLLVDPDRATVFIGSHSHRLQALDMSSGALVWERVLGDRLESSAAVSKCGTLVAVGSYDGHVYFLRVDSGETWWVFETEDTIKSSPTVDSQTGLVTIGSHDGHVYALEPLAKRCVWKHHCGSGAVFSSPCVLLFPRRLYSATLGGQLHCLSPDSGELLWNYSKDVPFFSSPSCSDHCVCIGSVNGDITAISHDGIVLWYFCTDGPVFSSPCFSPMPSITNQKTGCGTYDSDLSTSQVVVCGSHDSSLYGLNSSNGALLWRYKTSGKVYSSPFVCDGTPWGIRMLVVVASTDGTVWVLDGEQGTLKASLSLPGELFSSPVVWGHNIVVGCRNDYVYCLDLTDTKTQ
ncbi:beta-alanine-activating enzyme [Hoplias malabaricus]|uniref:beta-alanine-activating enzyme n=1 Tax=Hoplias malabaricus TaxID=27720 RepID=UPI003462FC58